MDLDNIIYFDNSSTTKPCETAVKYINKQLSENWGNPSSLHTMGIYAEEELTKTRNCISGVISSRPDEIYFCGSGTEANNIAIMGAALANKRRGNKIITSAVEHHSVLETVDALEKQGFEVVKLKPDKNGRINEEQIYNAVDDKTILVSLMLVNNELGTIMPVESIKRAVIDKNSPAIIHCDSVQAFGKLPINVQKLGVDLLSASAHKIHGPKGVGFLYKKKNLHIETYIHGGGQEHGLRSGTESVPLISGLRGAVEELPNTALQLEKQLDLWNYAYNKLIDSGLASINSPIEHCLPYILNISVNGYRSETLLHFLDSKGIFVSSGSACAKGQKSHVMTECGFDNKRIDSALRLSFCRYNNKKEIERFCDVLKEACTTLRKAQK